MAARMARDLALVAQEPYRLDHLFLLIHEMCTKWAVGHFQRAHGIKLNRQESDTLVVLMLKEIFRILASFRTGKKEW